MSTAFQISLLGVVVAVAVSRFLIPAAALRSVARHLTAFDLSMSGIGVGGLVLHCGAMFFRSQLTALPGTRSLTKQIDALGTVSMAVFAASAGLVLLGLRTLPLIVVAVVLFVLAAVGITMYDGGSLRAHLTALFIAVVVLTVVAAFMALAPRPPDRTASALTH